MPRSIRRHTRIFAAAGVAVVALAGGGVAYAATSGGASPTAAPRPAVTALPPSASHHGEVAKRARHGARGTVTAINGDTWTIKTARGVSLAVTVSAQTRYGTRAAPGSATSYPVGAEVAVIGTRDHRSVTATRIYTPKAQAAGATTPTTNPPAPAVS